MNFKEAADDLDGLKEIMSNRNDQFCSDALDVGMKKCEDWNVEINHRTRKRKKMLGETEADAGLSSTDETNRVSSRCNNGWIE